MNSQRNKLRACSLLILMTQSISFVADEMYVGVNYVIINIKTHSDRERYKLHYLSENLFIGTFSLLKFYDVFL